MQHDELIESVTQCDQHPIATTSVCFDSRLYSDRTQIKSLITMRTSILARSLITSRHSDRLPYEL